jgi:hypothetical protein
MSKHFSDKREPKNSSKTHWSVPQIHNFNETPSNGAEHDPSREHIEGPQAKKNEYQVKE